MRADARRNYERIISVAREAFAEHGPEAPLDDIARRACVGPGTLYRHFPNREALIEAVYRADIERLSGLARELMETHSPGDALAEWMRSQIDFATRKRGLAATLKAAMDRDSETFALCKVMINDAVRLLVNAAQEAGVIRDDVEPRDLLLMTHGIVVASEATPGAAERLLTVVLDGLRPQPR
ncbi:TetR/AcrR family transcriptional regulator [Amycolatopsis acidiphila]|uniref:TetR/AcrR family transcriptional regulator n=2 Tax=Amycolatopsis acidiphila TaxID=715473 RepID=A0A558A9W7_9PSEU|nr:TetR/AcrR family transcriptional regulator [Amycolatopsis acidiphila]UIJ63777.1 TetR/AcrR family transcriptional regulator [Amycolatopsis acidiphila]GHG78171.1 TetR family transcriptional regulator [Amycolatopsis acidiphila]